MEKTKKGVGSFLKNTKIQVRLYAILALLTIPLLVVTAILAKQNYDEVAVFDAEIERVGLYEAGTSLLNSIPLRRGSINQYNLDKSDEAKGHFEKYSGEVEKYLKLLESGTEKETYEIRDDVETFRKDWTAVQTRGFDMDVPANTKAHQQLIDTASLMLIDLERYFFVNDNDEAVLTIMNEVTYSVPQVVAAIGILRRIGRPAATRGSITEEESIRSLFLIENMVRANDKVSRAMGLLLRGHPELKGTVGRDADELNRANKDYVEYYRNSFLAGAITVGADDQYAVATKTMEANAQYSDKAVKWAVERIRDNRAKTMFSLTILLGCVVGLLVLTAISLLVVIRSITKPLHATVSRVTDIAEGEGDLTKRLEVDSTDEVGVLGSKLNQFIVTLDSMIGQVSSVSLSLGGYSQDLGLASQGLSAGSEEVASQSQTIAAAATQMNQNLQVLSSAIEEMSISIGEVARKSSEAAAVASEANSTAVKTGEIVSVLGQNAQDIGQVIETIAAIAAQTNLLALNAAIEAAGAGEAGKGFAVVASEVKELARQSAESSDEIKTKITAIRESTSKVVEAIDQIVTINAKVNEISSSIAASVEEQSITAKEVSANISQSSKAANDVTSNINGISSAAKGSAQDAEKTSSLAKDLQRMSGDLTSIVSKFKFSKNGNAA